MSSVKRTPSADDCTDADPLVKRAAPPSDEVAPATATSAAAAAAVDATDYDSSKEESDSTAAADVERVNTAKIVKRNIGILVVCSMEHSKNSWTWGHAVPSDRTLWVSNYCYSDVFNIKFQNEFDDVWRYLADHIELTEDKAEIVRRWKQRGYYTEVGYPSNGYPTRPCVLKVQPEPNTDAVPAAYGPTSLAPVVVAYPSVATAHAETLDVGTVEPRNVAILLVQSMKHRKSFLSFGCSGPADIEVCVTNHGYSGFNPEFLREFDDVWEYLRRGVELDESVAAVVRGWIEQGFYTVGCYQNNHYPTRPCVVKNKKPIAAN